MADPRCRMVKVLLLIINERHKNLTAIIKDYAFVSQLLDFIRHLTFFTLRCFLGNLDFANKSNNMMS